MKTPITTPVIGTLLLALSTTQTLAGDTSRLTVNIEGITSQQGQAIFVLMDSEASHHGKAPIFSKTITPVDDLSAQAEFDLPAGEYSAVVYHDLNANGKLDTNFFGKPKEPYGFSNNARGMFGIPSFAESRIVVGASDSQLNITVQ